MTSMIQKSSSQFMDLKVYPKQELNLSLQQKLLQVLPKSRADLSLQAIRKSKRLQVKAKTMMTSKKRVKNFILVRLVQMLEIKMNLKMMMMTLALTMLSNTTKMNSNLMLVKVRIRVILLLLRESNSQLFHLEIRKLRSRKQPKRLRLVEWLNRRLLSKRSLRMSKKMMELLITLSNTIRMNLNLKSVKIAISFQSTWSNQIYSRRKP